ncbi:MAG: hypothetical protein ACI4QR_07290, partial [Eubacteriales bacterium]
MKYKIFITGIDGDAELLDAIEFTIKLGEEDIASDISAERHLAAGESSAPLTIVAHMRETAGNEYQGKSIDGIGITVVATQDTVESDSNNNQYDAGAEYQVVVSANIEVTPDNKVEAEKTVESAKKADDNVTPLAKVTIPSGAAVLPNTQQLLLTIDETAAPANFVASVGADNRTFEVDMKGLDKQSNTELFKVEIYVGTSLENLVMKHNGASMRKKTSLASLTADQDYYYDSASGFVTFLTSTFSPFTVE